MLGVNFLKNCFYSALKKETESIIQHVPWSCWKTYMALIRGNEAGTLFLSTILSGHDNIWVPFAVWFNDFFFFFLKSFWTLCHLSKHYDLHCCGPFLRKHLRRQFGILLKKKLLHAEKVSETACRGYYITCHCRVATLRRNNVVWFSELHWPLPW